MNTTTPPEEDEPEPPSPDLVDSFGVLQNRLVVIGHTPRGAVRHVFSMRKANDREQTRFAPYFGF